jgi:hypothetical protein
LGVKHVRVPWTDLEDSLQSQRLAILRDEGVGITATSLWSAAFDLHSALGRHHDQVDGWEVQVPGTAWPSTECLQIIRSCGAEFRVPMALMAIVPRQFVPGKYYPRNRMGYKLRELEELNRWLAEREVRLDRVLCRVGVDESPWEAMEEIRRLEALSHIGAIDCAIEFQVDDRENAKRGAEALFAMALVPGSRLYLEPLVDIDRMMDVSHGLLNSLCNPRPVFQVVRCLNTILHSIWEEGLTWQLSEAVTGREWVRALISEDVALSLFLPPGGRQSQEPMEEEQVLPGSAGDAEVIVYRLQEGTSERVTLKEVRQSIGSLTSQEPILLVRRRGSQ